MSDILFGAALLVAMAGWFLSAMSGAASEHNAVAWTRGLGWSGLALIAVALWLAYAAGGA